MIEPLDRGARHQETLENSVIHGVDPLPGGGLGGRRQGADLTAGQRHRRAVPEVLRLQCGQLVQHRGGGEGGCGARDGIVEGFLIEQCDLLGVVWIRAVGHQISRCGNRNSLGACDSVAARRCPWEKYAPQSPGPPPAGRLKDEVIGRTPE